MAVSELFLAMATMKKMFDENAGSDGDCSSLSKAEMLALLKAQQFPVNADKAKMDELFQKLDHDKNGSVSFEEFVTFVAAMTVACFTPV